MSTSPTAVSEEAPPAASHTYRAFGSALVLIGLIIGVTLAQLFAYNHRPLPSLYNQLLAYLGFGILLAGLGAQGMAVRLWWKDGVSAALLLMLVAALASPIATGLPWSIAFPIVAALVSALVVVQVSRNMDRPTRDRVFMQLCLTLVAAGLLSVVVATVQLFAPTWTDDLFVAYTNGQGRAVGNMRQPNSLATLLLWSCVAAVWLMRSGWLARVLRGERRARVALVVLLTLFAHGVLFSASRTGMVGLVLLALWGLIDAVLARSGRARLDTISRIGLALLPVMWAAGWPFVSWWTETHGLTFFTQERLATEGAGSSERLRILHDTWVLITQHPWVGTGWGNFNFVWALTPFAEGHPWLADHSHNLFLQLMAEMGVPLGGLASLLLLAGIAVAARKGARDRSGAGICAFMLLLVVGLHCMSEYPLWYAYFLLPTALAYGCCMVGGGEAPLPGVSVHGAQPVAERATETARPPDARLVAFGVVMAICALLAAQQYRNIVDIYEPPPGAPPVIERIALAQESLFFALHADEAAAQMVPPGPYALTVSQRASRRLVTGKLAISWAQGLDAVGQTDKARFVAARLRESRYPLAEEFFKPCQQPVETGAKRPFQCEAPSREYQLEDLR